MAHAQYDCRGFRPLRGLFEVEEISDDGGFQGGGSVFLISIEGGDACILPLLFGRSVRVAIFSSCTVVEDRAYRRPELVLYERYYFGLRYDSAPTWR